MAAIYPPTFVKSFHFISCEEDDSAGWCRERGLCRDKSRQRRTRSLSPLRSETQWHLPGSEAEPCKLEENADDEKAKNGEATAVASSKKGKSGSKRWMNLKDFLYRSKSEGRGHTREKLWALSFSSSSAKHQHFSSSKASAKKMSQEGSGLGSGSSSAKQGEKFKAKNNNASNFVLNSGNQNNRSVNGPGARRVPVFAHELHYTANRAQAEELRRNTYLPYRQGLFGCLGFSSKSYTTINGFARSLHPTLSISDRLHVVLIPWLAQGHILPCIELSKRLLDKGNIKISIVSTPLNIAQIKRSFTEKEENLILVELPLPCVDGLPPGLENTSHLPTHLTLPFHNAVKGLQKPLEILLEQIAPDIVIFDHILCWISKVTLKLKIRSIVFFTHSAAYAGYVYCPERRSQAKEITTDVLLPPPADFPFTPPRHRQSEMASLLLIYTFTYTSGEKFIDLCVDSYYDCSAVAIKTCYELEAKFIDYFQRVTGSVLVPVGALLPRPYPLKQIEINDGMPDCLRWLENQRPASVVYVSFGSECFLSEKLIEEIAEGLEASLQPFMWVLRLPGYLDESMDEVQRKVSASLPQGFESRVAERGMVLSGWAPQQEILCHPSTGAFVTHCGWSSLMEGLGAGLPLIALPMQLDQGLNAELIVHEFQVGVEVERGSDGTVSRGGVCKAVKMVMDEEEGRVVRSKAAEMGDLFKEKLLEDERSQGSQNKYVDDLVKLLHSLKHKTNK